MRNKNMLLVKYGSEEKWFIVLQLYWFPSFHRIQDVKITKEFLESLDMIFRQGFSLRTFCTILTFARPKTV